jgi:hypothetical protein
MFENANIAKRMAKRIAKRMASKKCHKFDTTMFQITKKTGVFGHFQK